MQNIRLSVIFFPAMTLLLGLCFSLYDLTQFLQFTGAVHHWILSHFYMGFNWIALIAIVLLVTVALSPIGKLIIGSSSGQPVERLLNPFQWTAITLCTTIAAGLLLWGVAEPIFHQQNPLAPIQPGTDKAAQFALTSVYHNWTMLPYAVYCFAGLVIAVAHHQMGQFNAVSAPVIWGMKQLGMRRQSQVSGVIDSIALFAVAAGIATSLGTGILALAGGVTKLTGYETNWGITLTITLAIVVAFLMSSISGLKRGIAFLSKINTWIFLIFMALIVIYFPPSNYAHHLGPAIIDFSSQVFGRASGIDPATDTQWFKDWTSFYMAVWIAWAPIAGVFLAYIAKGYSVRAFIIVNLVIPALFSGLWLTLIGGASLSYDGQNNGAIANAIDTNGTQAGVYELLSGLPFSEWVIVAFLFTSFLSFVTATDSNTLSIVQLCSAKPTKKQEVLLKSFWAFLFGTVAWIMVSSSGVDGIRMMSNLGALPALIILVLYVPAFIGMSIKLLKHQPINKTKKTQCE